MSRDQIPELAGLEKVCFSTPWSEASLASELDNPLSLWLTACSADGILGYAGSQTCSGEADVMNIAVRPDCRQQGIGKVLLDALWEALLARGAYSLTLDVRVGNEPALALYRACGFREVGRRKNYYRHPTEDAYIMKKEREGHEDPVSGVVL